MTSRGTGGDAWGGLIRDGSTEVTPVPTVGRDSNKHGRKPWEVGELWELVRNLDLKSSSHPPTTPGDSDSGALIFTSPPAPQLGPSCLSLEMLTQRRRKDAEAPLTVLPEVLQLGSSEVQAVDPGQDVCHGPVAGPAPARRHRGQRHGLGDVASNVLQQAERSAKDAGEANWDQWG